jgi:hypothetical protein
MLSDTVVHVIHKMSFLFVNLIRESCDWRSFSECQTEFLLPLALVVNLSTFGVGVRK